MLGTNSEKRASPETYPENADLARLLLDSTAEAIYGIDMRGNCTFCNSACLRFLGYKDSVDLIGKNMHATMHHTRPDGTPYPNGECRIYSAFRRGQGSHVDDEVVWRADGSSFPVEYWSYPIRKGDDLIGAVVTFVDISDRRKAEHALQQSEEMFRMLAENIREIFFIFVPNAPRMAYISPACEEISGRPRREFYQQADAWIDSVHSEDRRHAEAVFRRSLQGIPTDLEYRLVRSDGAIRWIHARSFPAWNSKGELSYIVGIAEDITEHKRALEQMEVARTAAEAANRAKSEFLANMSHEIRTPLNGVMGMTDLALQTQLTAEQREYLETVKTSADSLLRVINDILDFSKIEAGKIDLEATDFNLRDCLESTLKTQALRADGKGLELLCELAPEVPEIVRGDSSRLRQVVVNLIGNAIKFTNQGEVALYGQVDAQDGKDRLLHFIVSDTGVGIPEEKRDSIFAPFTQADSSTTRKYGGTGLGLSISKSLVIMMGGTIWVESKVRIGSQFHFTVRMEAVDQQDFKTGVPSDPALLPGVKVLVVDDNPNNRRILGGTLGRWSMTPKIVESGNEALAELSSARNAGEPYRLVLTDMRMPKMDGFALVEEIRKKPELSTTAIMMLTSADHPGDAARCRELGVAAYLLKPIRQSDLREAIERVLGARKLEGEIPLITRFSHHDARAPGVSLKILLAEDNSINQRLAVRLLEKRGHRVVVAGNGREALEALARESFDLVLMDIQMPEMDGLESIVAIRESEKSTGHHQTVIALTAHAMKGDRNRCLAAGMDGYITKPIRAEELDKLLETYLAKRIRLGPP